MPENDDLKKEISIMQKHLKNLRQLAGWTSEELGLKLGITKQAVSALENNASKMSQLHYLALIHLFETKCTEAPENPNIQALKSVMEILFSDQKNYEKKEKQIDNNVTELAKTVKGGLSSAIIATMIPLLLNPIAAVGVGVAAAATGTAIGTSSWSKKILAIGKKQNNTK